MTQVRALIGHASGLRVVWLWTQDEAAEVVLESIGLDDTAVTVRWREQPGDTASRLRLPLQLDDFVAALSALERQRLGPVPSAEHAYTDVATTAAREGASALAASTAMADPTPTPAPASVQGPAPASPRNAWLPTASGPLDGRAGEASSNRPEAQRRTYAPSERLALVREPARDGALHVQSSPPVIDRRNPATAAAPAAASLTQEQLARSFRLTRWPPADVLVQHRYYPRLASFLSGRPITLDGLASQSNVNRADCERFLGATAALRLLEISGEVRVPMAPATSAKRAGAGATVGSSDASTATPDDAPRTRQLGLIQRLRLRLGIGPKP